MNLLCDSLTQLVRQNESRFVLAVKVTGKLHHADALERVHDQKNRGQQVQKVHLAARKDRARGHAKLVRTCLAFELAARGDFVGLIVVALWANSLTVSLRPAHFAEGLVRRLFASLVDAAKA